MRYAYPPYRSVRKPTYKNLLYLRRGINATVAQWSPPFPTGEDKARFVFCNRIIHGQAGGASFQRS